MKPILSKRRAKGGFGEKAAQPNNLLAFMLQMGKRTRHMILGTGTPIQTNVRELWDLLGVLNSGADFILGDSQSPWQNHEQGIPMATGKILQEVSYGDLKRGSVIIDGQETPASPLSSYSKAREIAETLKLWIQKGDFTLGESQMKFPGYELLDGDK